MRGWNRSAEPGPADGDPIAVHTFPATLADGSSVDAVASVHRNPKGLALSIEVPGIGTFTAPPNDLFACLAYIRQKHLEPLGVRVCCQGARMNTWASGMQRDMGGGIVCYVLEMGRPPRIPEDDVRTLDPAPCEEIATVAEQREWYARWRESV